MPELADLGLPGVRGAGFGNRNGFCLFIDGPLKGQSLPVPRDTGSYQCIDPTLPLERQSEYFLTYRITQIGFHHGGDKVLIRIATLSPADWSADDLADVMLNDEAKKARFDK